MTEEYWRWPESRWTNQTLDCKTGDIVSAGIDVGSVSSQAVILVDGRLYSYSNTRTGSDSPQSAQKSIDIALQDTGMSLDDIHYVVGTGYGRVNVPFAKKTLTEIACHARGANFIYGPTVRTILDMGGQDCKVIHCDSKGKVINFLMNDKCAAGTGRGMEVLANLVSIPIAEIGRLSFQVDEEPPPVSSTCVIFAKTEAVGLLRKGWPKEKVLAAYSVAMAHRVVKLLERIGMEKEFAITGGIAKNEGIVKRIERELNIKALEPRMDTQIAGALGGALFAKDLAESEPESAAID
jgi:bzd-type benzoyl-CoA reductase Q subunit